MQLLAIIFAVSVALVPASVFLRPDFLLAGVGALIAVRSRHSRFAVRLVMPEMWFLMALMLLAMVTLISQLLLKGGFVFRDLMILLRYAFYACALLFGAAMGAMTARPNQMITRAVLFGAVFVVTVTIAQYFDPGGFVGALTLKLYGRPDAMAIAETYWRQPMGTLGNPNYWGYYAGALMMTAVTYVLFGGKIKWVVVILGLLWAIILSGSRTALVAPVLAWAGLVLLLTTVGHEKIGRAVILACTFVGIATIGFYIVMTQGGYENAGRFSLENTKTLDMRIAHWGRLWAEIGREPLGLILGAGPQKAVGPLWADNMYLRLLRNYGVVAAGTYVAFLWFVARRLVRLLRGLGGAYRLHVIAVLLAWLLMAAFDSVADTWFNVRIASLVLFIHGFIIAAVARHVRQEKKQRTAARTSTEEATGDPDSSQDEILA